MDDRRRDRAVIAVGALLALGGAAASAQQSTALDEIEVTAQKRVESLQDVPIAVSAVGGDKIADARIMRIEELKNYVPTLLMTESRLATIFPSAAFSGVNLGFEQSLEPMWMACRGVRSRPVRRFEPAGRGAAQPQSMLSARTAWAGPSILRPRVRRRVEAMVRASIDCATTNGN